MYKLIWNGEEIDTADTLKKALYLQKEYEILGKVVTIKSGNSKFITIVFEVVDDSEWEVEKGDLFIDEDYPTTIECCLRKTKSWVVNTECTWHNPKSIRRIVQQVCIN